MTIWQDIKAGTSRRGSPLVAALHAGVTIRLDELD